MMLGEGEMFRQAEYDALIKEIEPQRPQEDPKKKKLASGESNEVDSKGKKNKNKNGDEDNEYVLKIPTSRFNDYMTKRMIEPPPFIIMRKKDR
ncbi:MAG: hypothetical protein EZS28_052181 [Streblomastix strix]|uniref:Uncharacterized protein n=1 Tax=Streblomastix strix TaxID=222440 RepID=A0A5J4SIY6_9EUKA|nr:MAG: hypothetical protein EZS28_052181 [Streblomastix strix]